MFHGAWGGILRNVLSVAQIVSSTCKMLAKQAKRLHFDF